ncbi:MAG: HAD hydrolase-like protein [Ignavibacteriales bacterium]|nr:hypothetical protein [Ignavibacteriaceae bacterium]MBW7874318.1 HAD hydrolase-like protein [Ignavibacteria bacterium]MCZ2142507.1 HAD hydrolase-like protein [Ignavibacteriales bacterium]OQY76130.1 MAG: hypothetical protein B6D45_04495 [Ignavibacteriales bacterium UTCHB3]WKZ72826.1 MAG: HAD hydrolase-like protein [Ignavibacteriaceae bacterium]
MGLAIFHLFEQYEWCIFDLDGTLYDERQFLFPTYRRFAKLLAESVSDAGGSVLPNLTGVSVDVSVSGQPNATVSADEDKSLPGMTGSDISAAALPDIRKSGVIVGGESVRRVIVGGESVGGDSVGGVKLTRKEIDEQARILYQWMITRFEKQGREGMFQEMVQRFNFPLSVESLVQLFRESFDFSGMRLFEFVPALFTELINANKRVMILTNGYPQQQRAKVRALGLDVGDGLGSDYREDSDIKGFSDGVAPTKENFCKENLSHHGSDKNRATNPDTDTEILRQIEIIYANEISPKPSWVLADYLKKRYRYTPEKVIFIGDSSSDNEFARVAGFKFLSLSDIEQKTKN